MWDFSNYDKKLTKRSNVDLDVKIWPYAQILTIRDIDIFFLLHIGFISCLKILWKI